MGHLYLSIIENCHLAYFLMIAGIFSLDFLYESAVDFLDNLVNTGQQSGEQLNRPFLKGFRHNRMIGIRTGLCGHCPCLFPCQEMLIHQHAHQLCHCYRGMGIVQLECGLFIEFAHILMISHIFGNRLLYGSGDKEVLLFQTQFLAGIVIVIGVEYFHNIPCQVFLLHSLLIISLVKRVQLKTFNGLGIPDTQRIHHPIAIAHNGQIIGNRLNRLIPFLNKMLSAAFICPYRHVATELHFFCIFRAAQFKGIAIHQPVVGYFHLITVTDFLLEHTVAVADTTSICRVSKRRQ